MTASASEVASEPQANVEVETIQEGLTTVMDRTNVILHFILPQWAYKLPIA
ncbi:hypothetical protein H1R20_g12437, partial [Candolleomyces eurysporus]